MISDTPLRSFIPPQVRKITPRLRHICGFELCIILKDTKISLNRFRTEILSDLYYKSVGRHTNNITYSNTGYAYYKDKVFLYGEFSHATILCTILIFVTSNPILAKRSNRRNY